MTESKQIFAVVFVGIPGTGKTTIGKALVDELGKQNHEAVYLDQDMAGKKQDYLDSIENALLFGKSVVLGKSHHTSQTRKEVFDILTKHNVQKCVVNLVPDEYVHSTDKFVPLLLSRIRGRDPLSSTLTSDDAPKVLKEVFGPKQFQRPVEVEQKLLLNLPLEWTVAKKTEFILAKMRKLRLL